MINHYFKDFADKITNFDLIVSSEIIERKVNDFFGIIEGKLYFENGILEFLEVITVYQNKLCKKKYKYHLRNKFDEMIFRYDNAPHHANITTFPHHKHLKNDITESEEPDILLILAEIKMYTEKYRL